MPRHLTEADTCLILKLHYNGGLTQKQIATRLNCCQKTVSNKIVTFESENRLTRKKSCRKLKANQETLSSINDSVDFDPFISLNELKNELNLPQSLSTISRYVKRAGVKLYFT